MMLFSAAAKDTVQTDGSAMAATSDNYRVSKKANRWEYSGVVLARYGVLSVAKDGFDGPPAWINLAIARAWTGGKDRALAALADILHRPSYLNVY